MNTIIINTSAVIAARESMEKAIAYYKDLKKQVFSDMIKIMTKTGKAYTLAELSEMTGLNSQSIIGVLTYRSNSMREELDYPDFGTDEKVIEETFVRLLPDGTIDKNRTIHTNRRVTTYYIKKSR